MTTASLDDRFLKIYISALEYAIIVHLITDQFSSQSIDQCGSAGECIKMLHNRLLVEAPEVFEQGLVEKSGVTAPASRVS